MFPWDALPFIVTPFMFIKVRTYGCFTMQKKDIYLAVSVQLFPGGIGTAFCAELLDGFVKYFIQPSNVVMGDLDNG